MKMLPPDSLAAQHSQVDKLCSLSPFVSLPPPPPSSLYPAFRPPVGTSRDYILDGTNLPCLLKRMHSVNQYVDIKIDSNREKKHPSTFIFPFLYQNKYVSSETAKCFMWNVAPYLCIYFLSLDSEIRGTISVLNEVGLDTLAVGVCWFSKTHLHYSRSAKCSPQKHKLMVTFSAHLPMGSFLCHPVFSFTYFMIKMFILFFWISLKASSLSAKCDLRSDICCFTMLLALLITSQPPPLRKRSSTLNFTSCLLATYHFCLRQELHHAFPLQVLLLVGLCSVVTFLTCSLSFLLPC